MPAFFVIYIIQTRQDFSLQYDLQTAVRHPERHLSIWHMCILQPACTFLLLSFNSIILFNCLRCKIILHINNNEFFFHLFLLFHKFILFKKKYQYQNFLMLLQCLYQHQCTYGDVFPVFSGNRYSLHTFPKLLFHHIHT